MKKAFKILIYLILVFIAILSIFAAYIHFKGIPTYEPPKIKEIIINPTADKIEEGARISSLLCSSCHLGNDGKLSGGFMRDLDEAFGKTWVKNITNDSTYGIGSWTPGEIVHFLRTGVRKDGRFAPPWMPKFPRLSDADMEAVVCYLKSDRPQVQASQIAQPESQPSFLSKLLANFVFKPLEYPQNPIKAPDTSNLIAYGKYIVQSKIECYSCHSKDFKKMDLVIPENSLGYLGGGNLLLNLDREQIFSPNITMDVESGLGKWSYEDFKRALLEGKRPDGKVLRYPMLPLTNLKDFEIQSIWAYLQTVPKISNNVDRTGL
ncbi:MAG: cytochrome c [Saprospiraceae bacterium]|nr:cytochrome c [Saprospiraceae bacterium]